MMLIGFILSMACGAVALILLGCFTYWFLQGWTNLFNP